MKKFVFILLIALMAVVSSEAKIRRVGFFATPLAGTDYVNFTAAYNAASTGDTILMFPNTTLNGTFTKRLVIIGPGNWLDPTTTPKGNANMQAFPGYVTLSSVILNAGSEGTVIAGMQGGSIYINVSNVKFLRNAFVTVYVCASNTANTVDNLQVLQNYRVILSNYYTNGSSCTNMNVSNNLIAQLSTAMGNTYSGLISNNAWAWDNTQNSGNLNGGSTTFSNNNSIELGAGAYLLQNNIFLSYSSNVANSNYNYYYFSNGGNSVFNYNLILQANSGPSQTWGAGTGNVITPIANAANIFEAFPLIGTASADARYQLKAGSPALTVGAGGTPIGMYAGTYPYKLSTIPAIPSIYSISSPQGNNPPGNTMQINVSTRGNN